jgi:hypothetical protein
MLMVSAARRESGFVLHRAMEVPRAREQRHRDQQNGEGGGEELVRQAGGSSSLQPRRASMAHGFYQPIPGVVCQDHRPACSSSSRRAFCSTPTADTINSVAIPHPTSTSRHHVANARTPKAAPMTATFAMMSLREQIQDDCMLMSSRRCWRRRKRHATLAASAIIPMPPWSSEPKHSLGATSRHGLKMSSSLGVAVRDGGGAGRAAVAHGAPTAFGPAIFW